MFTIFIKFLSWRIGQFGSSILLIFFINTAYAQCPQLLDGNGAPSNNPYWISCTGANFQLFIQSNTAIGAYTIDWGDGSPVSNGASISTGTFVTHTYASAVDTFIVTFTETSSGCVITGVVVMEVTPSASIQIPVGSPIFGCTPATFAFKNASTNVSQTTRFTWYFGDGSPIEYYDYTNWSDTIYHTYLPGTTNCNVPITLTAENYCNLGTPSTNIYQPIQVWDIDNTNITPDATVLCFPNATVHYDNNTNLNCFALGNTAQRYEYWNFGDYWGKGYDSIVDWQPFNPPNRPGYNITYPGLGTYTAMLIDSSYCGRDTDIVSISIIPPPAAGISANKDTICEGQSITFTNLSGGGANSYTWNYGDGSANVTTGSKGNRTHVYNNAGTFTVSLIARITGATGCLDTATYEIVVRPAPISVFSNNNPVSCDTATVAFTDASTDAIAWSWNFGNFNTSNSPTPPSQFYNAPGNYTVSLVVTSANGCTDTSITVINVYQSPVANFSTSNACVNSPATFTDLSTFSVGDPITDWIWDFGDGSPTGTSANPTHVYSSAGTYSVILSVSTANCSGIDTIPIIINPLPIAQFTPVPSNGCTPLNVNFTNTSSGAVSYVWSFGDGSAANTSTNPTHNYTNSTQNDTTYSVSMIAQTSFGCTDTSIQNNTVYHGTSANFTSDGSPGCSPLPVVFSNASIGAVKYVWNYGDGSPLDSTVNPMHTFINPTAFLQTYTISLVSISDNGCKDTAYQTVTIFPPSAITSSASPSDTGCYLLKVDFSSSSGGVVYAWDFGDGGTSLFQNPTHVFSNPGASDSIYQVRLIVTNAFSCKDTVDMNIVVHPRPNANFSVLDSSGCQPFTVGFTNLSLGAASYVWDFSDGLSPDSTVNPTHIFTNTTSSSLFRTINLVAISAFGCRDTASRIIEVYPQVIATFTADTIGCSILNPNFQNLSTGIVNSSWGFGDGTFSSSTNPIHNYVNTGISDTVFPVTLIVISAYGCEDTAYKNITVYPSPLSTFIATPSSQLYPSTTVSFTNNTNSGSWQYTWDFGDGSSSAQQSPPNHTYATWGTYTISLIVQGTSCSDTAYQTITIIPPLPVAIFKVSDSEGCEPLTIQFNDSSMYAESYAWQFGDGSLSNQQNPSHTYYNTGTYTVILVVTGAGGKDTASSIITVYVKPNAFFTSNPTTVFLPDQPINCYNLSSNSDSYLWDFGDSTTSTETNPSHIYESEGQKYITLYAFNSFGCRDTFIAATTVKVKEGGEIIFPTAFTPNPTSGNGGSYNSQEYSNDVFFPFTKGIVEFHLLIFNRWGELLFESKDVNKGWDGYYKGKLCEQDVYIWKASGTLINGDKLIKTGDVTLLR